jgi:membrane protease YdiL (CAAX protease family)
MEPPDRPSSDCLPVSLNPPRSPKAGNRGVTVLLGVLSLATILLLCWGENRSLSVIHEDNHLEELKRSLRIQSVYEKEPRAVRWLSGYLTENSFYREQTALALVAERDGYFTPLARQIMALAAHRAGDLEKAAYWREGPPAHRPGMPLPEENREALRQWPPDQKPTLVGMLDTPGDPFFPKEALGEYWGSVKSTVAFLILGILLLPCGTFVIQLLEGRHDRGESQKIRPDWGAGIVFGAWLRAKWCFAFGGIALLSLFYLAHLVSVGHVGGGSQLLTGTANVYLDWYAWLYAGWTGTLASVILITGPVWLLARKLTGGLSGMWHQFGLVATRQDWARHLRAAAGAAWLAFVLGSLLDPLFLRMGWFDPRDGWRFQSETLGLQLFFGCLIAPVVEEIVFRGFLFSAFTNRWTVLRAAVLSSLLFGGVHGYSWSGFLMVTLFGILLCGVYWRTRSLWAPILAHALFNTSVSLTWAL